MHLRAASLVADPEEPLVSGLAADLEVRPEADSHPAFARDDAGNVLAERARCADARWRCATGRVFRAEREACRGDRVLVASQSRAAPERVGFSLSKWRWVLRSLLKNRYRTTYRCYGFSETSSRDAFNAPIRASNRHHGGECDPGEGRHRLVGSTSMRSFSVVPLLPRSLSLHDVAVARGVLVSARPLRLRTIRSCKICVDAAS